MASNESERALVTGGAVRVGRAISLALADAGFEVAVHFHRSEEPARTLVQEIRGSGGHATAHRADLRAPGEIHELFTALGRNGRGLRVLVNNAAIFPRSPPERVSPADWDEVLALNTRAPFFCSVRARDLMSPDGAIVNIADVAAWEAWPSYAPYAASKAALVSLTRSLARAWAPQIRVNAVAPGPVLLPDDASPGERIAAADRTVLGRTGSADDVARAVTYLVSAGYVTGEVIRVDGGASLL